MSLAEIEAELKNLNAQELRRLALKSWLAFVEKEGVPGPVSQCDEDDLEALAALDKAIASADAAPQEGLLAPEVRQRLREWTGQRSEVRGQKSAASLIL